MKYRALAFLLLFQTPLFALQNGSSLMHRDDPEYMQYEAAVIGRGEVPPTSVHTMTRREFHFYAGQPEPESAERLNYHLDLYFMPYALAYSTPYGDFGERYPLDLYYINSALPSLFHVSGGIGYLDYVYISTGFDIRPDKSALEHDGAYSPAGGGYYGTGESPAEDYISLSVPHLSCSFGRFRSGIGQGFLGNTFLNGQAPFYDQLQLVLYTKRIRAYYMLGTSNSHLFSDELEVQNNSGYYKEDDYEADHIKVFIYHRIEYRPLDSLMLGLGAMNLFGGKMPDFSQLAPLGIYHNMYDPEHRAYMALADMTLVPAPGLMLYGEMLMNEIKLPGEANGDPTALGQQLGIKYHFRTGGSLVHRIAVEATHIDPWAYIDYVPYASMYQRIAGKFYYYDVPLGYTYGGDLVHYGVSYRVLFPGGAVFELRLHRLHKGEKGLGLDENGRSYYTGASRYLFLPSGTVERRSTAEVTLKAPLREHLLLSLSAYYSRIESFRHERGRNTDLAVVHGGAGWKL